MMEWKENWAEARQHYLDFWQGKGFVVSGGGVPKRQTPREAFEPRQVPEDRHREAYYTDPVYRADCCHHNICWREFPLDTLPNANINIGPGSLATMLGSKPEFGATTVWYHPIWQDVEDLESLPRLEFDPENRWWKITEQMCREVVSRARGRYLCGYPDLIENIDILASLRDNNNLMYDMIDRPEWVEQKVWQINEVWQEVHDRIYEIIKLPDGSSAWNAFAVYGPGKVAKVQCDAAAMFGPDMFRRFVVPAMEAQCEKLDASIFHLDGAECLCHLDALLEMRHLDAVEWTPSPKVPPGGDEHWYEMYRRILDAGKGVQAINLQPEQVIPLLDAIGTEGVFVICNLSDPAKVEELSKRLEAYR